uniref:Uncharacterized protein n=1 Tax=Candidatus Kentrum sp. TC TaxID=2126339 RepID=A0A450ZTG6_9GAMM|nr:MAG: hypothetical protein BECKTC1821F_GA0114240_101447 [Candidatus Kentron sp. TC]
MVDHLPLLVFPQARVVAPRKGKPSPPNIPHFPGHARQVERLTPQLDDLRREFSRYKASVSGAATGLEPEMVLVIEIAGSVNEFLMIKSFIHDIHGFAKRKEDGT